MVQPEQQGLPLSPVRAKCAWGDASTEPSRDSCPPSVVEFGAPIEACKLAVSLHIRKKGRILARANQVPTSCLLHAAFFCSHSAVRRWFSLSKTFLRSRAQNGCTRLRSKAPPRQKINRQIPASAS